MTAPSEAERPLIEGLAYVDRPERPAELPPVDDPGFLRLVNEVYPDLDYVRHDRSRGVAHVFRDRVSGEYAVLSWRDNGQHTVMETGFPWLDHLNQLAGMWQSTAPKRGA